MADVTLTYVVPSEFAEKVNSYMLEAMRDAFRSSMTSNLMEVMSPVIDQAVDAWAEQNGLKPEPTEEPQ